MRNYYEILEISEDASQEVIKAVYKALAKKYHPDCYSGDKKYAEKIMAQINEAYETLSDERKRADYDFIIKKKAHTEAKTENTKAEPQEKEPYQKEEYHEYEPSVTNVPFEDTYDEENTTEELGSIGKFFSGLGKHIVNTMQKNSQEINNAFIDGMNMDEYTLIKRFRQARGNKRYGYAKALEEKGLLERNSEGNFVPTYKFRMYL